MLSSLIPMRSIFNTDRTCIYVTVPDKHQVANMARFKGIPTMIIIIITIITIELYFS